MRLGFCLCSLYVWSQSIDWVETIWCEALARGPTKNARHDAYLTTEIVEHEVEGMPWGVYSESRESEGMAEREGFEPSVEILSLRRFSKPLPSATRPPLHVTISKDRVKESPGIHSGDSR